MLTAPFLTPAETKNIGATIRIVREIWCLPYAGFFSYPYHTIDKNFFFFKEAFTLIFFAIFLFFLCFSSYIFFIIKLPEFGKDLVSTYLLLLRMQQQNFVLECSVKSIGRVQGSVISAVIHSQKFCCYVFAKLFSFCIKSTLQNTYNTAPLYLHNQQTVNKI